MALRFYNTLSQQVEEFTPASQNTVRMYTCGPTVYDFAHIGNFRTFTFVDLLRKCLRANGFQLNHVMNITDVDDKIIRNAVASHQTLAEYTKIYTDAFLEDCAARRLERPERLALPPSTFPTWWLPSNNWAPVNTRIPARARPTSRSPASRPTASFRTTISAATWRAPGWTSMSTRRPTRAILRCGRRPRRTSPAGTPPSVRGAPGGISSARSWPSSTWERRWISTRAAWI